MGKARTPALLLGDVLEEEGSRLRRCTHHLAGGRDKEALNRAVPAARGPRRLGSGQLPLWAGTSDRAAFLPNGRSGGLITLCKVDRPPSALRREMQEQHSSRAGDRLGRRLRKGVHGVQLRNSLHGVQAWPNSLAGRGLCMSLSLWQALLWRRGRRASPLGLLWLTSPPSRLFFWGLPWICMAMLRR